MAKATATAPSESNKAASNTQGEGIPKWSLVLGAMFLVLGGLLFGTKDARKRNGLIEKLSSAQVQVNSSVDGFSTDFGEITITSNREDFLQVLGMCYSQSDQALAVFKGLMEANGKKEGRILGCRIAYSLLKDPGLTLEQKKEVFGTLREQLAENAAHDVRRVAQVWVGEIIAMRDLEKKEDYGKIPAPEIKSEEKLEAQTYEQSIEGGKVLLIRWSNPDACEAWWNKFGKDAKWDEKLKRFAVP